MRKIDYKITITALSAVISLVVGSIELLGLLADQFGLERVLLGVGLAVPI